ncbi:uncharacterized protein LOC123313705 [Coccinella septempunctata]|uniref:uncharacterized protein LOC123313705 n=1 Tax=Coccinella septempunctata TaxID=41139 RepID=UPI001D068758|nr:uncharacterized protein LOC123313705 [Coccinella septempunctata]
MLLCFYGLSILIAQAFASVHDTVDVIPDSYANSTDNTLWRTLLEDCKIPTKQCVEKNMYRYLKQVLEYPEDYSVTSFLKFAKNSLNYTQVKNDSSEEVDDGEDFQQRSTIDEMSRTFQEQGVKFLMTHDLEVQMPETFFEGATLKIAPRNLEGDGALVKMEWVPKKIPEGAVEGRIFFKKLKKKISQKLLYALLAILVVIKLLAVKFLFFLPMLMGVAAAKKLLIKILFFVFPAIKHLFKLCPYVPHGTKFHHHKHQIAHIHHLGGIHHHPHHHHDDGIEIIHPHADGPPVLAGSSLHHYVDIEPPHSPSYKPHEHDLEYYSGGPGLGEDIITNRKDPYFEENEIPGQGHGRPTKKNPNRPLTPAEIENMVLKAEKEALIKAKLQQEKKRIQEENALLQEQLRQAIKVQEQLKLQQMNIISKSNPLIKSSAPTVPSPFLQSPPPPPIDKIFNTHTFSLPNQLMSKPILKFTGPQANSLPNSVMYNGGVNEVHQGTATVSKQGAGQTQSTNKASDRVSASVSQVKKTQGATNEGKIDAQKVEIQKAIQKAASITYDPYYSPILMKIDKIMVNLGYTDEPCKERLICFMYKSPEKYSPHSNLLSNELSRDPSELHKPTNPNAAVLRFFRYFQAARDGQDKNDCIKLYTGCNVLGSEL